MVKRLSRKWILISSIFFLFLMNFFLLDKGLCYSEMTFLSKRQMLDRSIFGSDADKLGQSEKTAILKKQKFDNYPNNCAFTKGAPIGLSSFDALMYALTGRKVFAIQCVYDRGPSYKRTPHYIMSAGIASCGTALPDSYGDGISEGLFNRITENNTKFWKEQR